VTKRSNQFSHQDSDGFRYLDYLGSFSNIGFAYQHAANLLPNDLFMKTFTGFKAHFYAHKTALEKELEVHNGNVNVKSKFIWIAHQHNRVYLQKVSAPTELEKSSGLFSEFSLGIGIRRTSSKSKSPGQD